MVDFLSLDNFIEIEAMNVNFISAVYYIDVRYITMVRKKADNNYSIYVDKDWVYGVSEEDLKKVINMRKAIDRNNKINEVLNDNRDRG
jgi:hypothetical protein